MGWGPFDLTGKNAVVTGAAMGIGFGIARSFLDAGARVVLADRDADALDQARKRLLDDPAIGDDRIDAVAVDVAEDLAGTVMVDHCVTRFGSIEVLVNNAGIFPQSPVLTMTPDFLDRVLQVNLRGLILSSQAAGIRMVEQGTGGSIVNIASIDALHPSMVGLAAYDASKGGVLMFTKNLALELAPHGIRVNAIAPGGVSTEGTHQPSPDSSVTQAQADQILADFVRTRVPLGRIGLPVDIANLAVVLASEASSYMTGSIVVVDGGALLA